MRPRRLSGLLILLAAAWLQSAQPVAAQTGEGRLLGLVVGASDYGHGGLPLGRLTGPRNDALLIADLLVERGARPQDVLVLTEPEGIGGYQAGEGVVIAGPATAAAILEAFEDLTRRARPGDQVVVLLAGHGWRQREGVAGSEPDGLDEVFLPVDYGPLPIGFDRVRHDPVPGALRDDEIGSRLDALRARGADVFLIADFCHSGDSTRGPLDPGRPPSRESRLDPPVQAPGRGAYVAFFAAPAGDRAMQGLAPIWADPALRLPHGLLTAYTAAALRDPGVTTYAEAAVRVQASLLEHDVRDPAVRLDGPAAFEGDLERALPGLADGAGPVWTVRKPAVAARDGRVALSRLALDAGALHGLDEGALVAVAEVRGGRERVLLYGRATEITAAGAILVPAAHAGVDEQAWTDVRAADGRPYTDRRLWLARPVARGRARALTIARPRELAPLLEEIAAGTAVRWTEPGREADLHLHRPGGGRSLTLSASPDPAATAAVMGSLDLGDGPDQAERLDQAVGRAARAHRLRRLLGDLAQQADAVEGLATSFHLWRPVRSVADIEAGACPPFDARHAALGDRPPPDAVALADLGVASGEPVVLRPCDVVFIRVGNTGEALLDITALALAPDGAVWPLPWSGDRRAVRFEPGRTRMTAYQLDPRGSGELWEELAVVAVAADESGAAPFSLVRLRQPGVAAPPTPDGGGVRSDAALSWLFGTGEGLRGAGERPARPLGVRRLMIRVAD